MNDLRFLAPALLVLGCGEAVTIGSDAAGEAETGGSSTGTTATTTDTSDAGTGGASGTATGPGADRSCDQINDEYAAALGEALACDVETATDECVAFVPIGLSCACPKFLNPAHQDAIDAMLALAAEWNAAGCGKGVVCGVCEVDGVPDPTATCKAGVCITSSWP